jgi:hypothetical protein
MTGLAPPEEGADVLVFELSPAGELYVNADKRGLADLRGRLAALAAREGSGHIVLMTPRGGGWELEEAPQTEGGMLIHHVLIRLRGARSDEDAPTLS